ncbi:hypothetical protein, partial [Halorubrum sp. Atlit-26R]|uniref:hypothetical protein n=1 Tax=Halorubrum sp. Atlit-26R TaxID=2282128 RepID=UPI0011C46EAA
MSEGVIYYAVGEKYLNQATNSAKSLKYHNSVDVTVFTDQNQQPEIFDRYKVINRNKHPFYDRIKHFMDSPYDKTLYIDTDTFVSDNIQDIYQMLDRFDVVARIDPFRDTAGPHWGSDEYDVEAPDSFPEYQCGVLGYKLNSSVLKMFEDWRKRYSKKLESNLIDQPFFREAVYNQDNLKIGTLPPEYNLLVNNLNCLQEKAKILHFNGGYYDKKSIGRKETPEEILDQVNSEY